jgi:hypothetical protein
VKTTILFMFVLFGCSSAASVSVPTCEEACQRAAGLDTDAGDCLTQNYAGNDLACASACQANGWASCMAHAATCEAWTLCQEHAGVGTGAELARDVESAGDSGAPPCTDGTYACYACTRHVTDLCAMGETEVTCDPSHAPSPLGGNCHKVQDENDAAPVYFALWCCL